MIESINSDIHQNITTAFDILLNVPQVLFKGEMTDEHLANTEWNIVNNEIAIQKVDGPVVTFSWFYNNGNTSHHVITINEREMFTGGQGPNLPANNITMFAGSFDIIKKHMKKLCEMVEKTDPEYRGFMNIEVTIRDGKPYYRSIWFGATVDFLACLCSLYEQEIDECMDNNSTPDGIACSTRVFSYPYAENNNMRVELDLPVGDDSYIAINKGSKLKETWRGLFEKVKGVERLGMCYRTDGSEYSRRVYAECKRKQYI